jgi:hypothetical protein
MIQLLHFANDMIRMAFISCAAKWTPQLAKLPHPAPNHSFRDSELKSLICQERSESQIRDGNHRSRALDAQSRFPGVHDFPDSLRRCAEIPGSRVPKRMHAISRSFMPHATSEMQRPPKPTDLSKNFSNFH